MSMIVVIPSTGLPAWNVVLYILLFFVVRGWGGLVFLLDILLLFYWILAYIFVSENWSNVFPLMSTDQTTLLLKEMFGHWKKNWKRYIKFAKITKRFHPQKTKSESASRMPSRSLFENKFPEIFQIWRLIKHLSQHWYWPKFIVVTIS